MGIGQTTMVSYILDAVELMFIGLLLALGWPLLTLKALRAKHLRAHARVLGPMGLLPQIFHSILDYRLGRWELAVAGFEGVVSTLEDGLAKHPAKRRYKMAALKELYGTMAKMHLRRGFIEDAALVVIRAHRAHGFECFEGIKDFDYKTAQIVKAAVAASELIGDGGVAQVIVESSQPKKKGELSSLPKPTRKPSLPGSKPLSSMAKVIPFTNPNPH